MMAISITNMIGNLVLIVLMVKTERRTLENRRPEANDNLNVLLLSNEQPYRRRQNSDNIDGPFIRVKFYDKVIQGREGVNLFQLRVNVHGKAHAEIKLTKKYSDFQHLQALVNDQSIKQSDLFTDNSCASMSLDAESASRSYKLPNTIASGQDSKQHLQVPRLEEHQSAGGNTS